MEVYFKVTSNTDCLKGQKKSDELIDLLQISYER